MNAAAYCDVAVFFGFLIAVVVVGIGMSRQKKGDAESSESYFLAGRGLPWWLIGFSLIAANISTEQFVGMSGNAANYIGLAVASYEWVAALSLVIVAFVFLPRFLKAGVYTIPQFLETRYNKATRTLMSLTMIVILVVVNVVAVTYSAAKAYSGFFEDFGLPEIVLAGQVIPLNLMTFCWVIGILAASYVFVGGLKACAWADLIQGSALILCGCLILYFALGALGNADKETLNNAMVAMEFSPEKQAEMLPALESGDSYQRFTTLNSHKLRMNLPWTDGFLPITALLFGIWIPNLYYWGLNQYIVQRTLGSQSLSQGQKGIVFAAFLKLLIPFIVIFPGIMAFNLYHDTMKQRNYVDEDKFQKLTAEYAERGMLFSYDKEFVKNQPDVAVQMLAFNAKQTGFALPADYQEKPVAALGAMKDDFGKKWYWEQPKYGQTFSGYDHDSALSLLMQRLIPAGGLRGFVLAALLGAIISSLAAMYNATSTIFTMDIYKEYLHKKASEKVLVVIGRISVLLTMVFGCYLAPALSRPEFGGVFWFIQEFQGFISPGVLAAFLFGFLVRKAPRTSGLAALLLNPIIYGALMLFASGMSFLDRMSITFVSIIAVMTLMRILYPQKTPFKMEVATTIDLRQSKLAILLAIVVVILTVVLYAHFWDYETPMFAGMLGIK